MVAGWERNCIGLASRGHACLFPLDSGQIVEERGERRSPSVFWRGNAVPLAYTTAVGGRGKRPSIVRRQLPTTQATEKNVR